MTEDTETKIFAFSKVPYVMEITVALGCKRVFTFL